MTRMQMLKVEFTRIQTILELVVERENLKKGLLIVQQEIFEQVN